MAATPVEIIHGTSGLTDCTLVLYPLGSDDIANGAGDALTARTNRTWVYRATVDEALVGEYEAYMLTADGVAVYTGVVDMADDTNVHTAGEPVAGVTATATVGQETIEDIAEEVVAQLSAIPSVSPQTALDAATIERYRDTTWIVTVAGLGNVSDRQKLYFTARKRRGDQDASSLVQIEEGAGLLVANGNSVDVADSLKGSLVVTDDTLGNVTITLDADVSSQFHTGKYAYDFKMITANGVHLLSDPEAQLIVKATITRAVS